MSGGLFEAFEDLFSGVLDWLISSLVSKRKDDTELNNLMRQQRKEHIHIVTQWAATGKVRSLRGFDLSGAKLSGLDLSGADLTEANLQGAEIRNVDLSKAILREVNFSQAKLIEVNFHEADLQSADFSQSLFEKVDFGQANMRGTKLENVNMSEDCSWKGVRINAETKISRQIRDTIDSHQSFEIKNA